MDPHSVCGQVEGRGVSIDYPHFSPPGAATSLLSGALPEPLVSLPDVTYQQNVPEYGTGSDIPATVSSEVLFHPVEHLGSGSSSTLVETPNLVTNAANVSDLRVQYVENLCRDLQKEKNVMEEQFGQQRKKFMKLMVQKDMELSEVKKSVEQFSSEVVQLGQQLRVKEEEVRDMWAAVKVMEATTREAFDADRIIYEEEIASLRMIIEVERGEHQSEREGPWRDPSHNQLENQQRSPSPGDPTLESEMAKAVEESKQEIDDLKVQLDEVRERLQHNKPLQQPSTPPLIDWDTPLPSDTHLRSVVPGSFSPSPTNDSKLQQQLELERSARHDLEMHTKALEQQKAVMQEEIVTQQKTVDNLNRELTAQQESYQQLKQTWEMANQHFIVSQDKLRQQMYYVQQKQLLLQPPQPPSRGSSPQSSDVEASQLSYSEYRLTSSRRSHSWGELREREGGSQLQTRALESELKRVKRQLEQRLAMCVSYESQLQRVQEQMLEELDEKDQELSRLREECSKARAGVMRERRVKEELRRKMEDAREQYKAQVERFQTSMQALQAKLKSLKEQYTQSKHEAQRDLAKFSDERVSLFAQISSAQEEYDCLKVVQAEEAQKYAQHISEEKKERKMMEGSLTDLQLRLTELQQEKVAVEDRLGSQLAQLNEKFLSEQRSQEKQEFSLNRQLTATITNVEQMKAELDRERHMKEEAVAARSALEEKSRQFIQEQHQKLEREVAGRLAAEHQVRELQTQMSSLRSQLNSSQENQKDFVELSQALQVKLAQIEEEQKFSSPPHPP